MYVCIAVMYVYMDMRSYIQYIGTLWTVYKFFVFIIKGHSLDFVHGIQTLNFAIKVQ